MLCYVYRNLHRKGHVYSIKAQEGEYSGRVIGYASAIHIETAIFVVSQAGRERARREKKRNVHAGILGYIKAVDQYIQRLPNNLTTHGYKKMLGDDLVTYNPFKHETFILMNTNEPIYYARKCNIWSGEVRVFEAYSS